MGMVLGLNALSDAKIAKLLEDPPLVWQVLAPDEPEFYASARRSAETRPGFWARLFGRQPRSNREPESTDTLELAANEKREADLDKAWHGIRYLLTGSAWEGADPLAFLITGGEEIGDIDVGYGPARAIVSDMVREIDAALAAVSIEEFKTRFAPDKMMKQEIYPEIWDRKEEDGNHDDLVEYFQILNDFMADAARNKMGIIVSMS